MKYNTHFILNLIIKYSSYLAYQTNFPQRGQQRTTWRIEGLLDFVGIATESDTIKEGHLNPL